MRGCDASRTSGLLSEDSLSQHLDSFVSFFLAGHTFLSFSCLLSFRLFLAARERPLATNRVCRFAACKSRVRDNRALGFTLLSVTVLHATRLATPQAISLRQNTTDTTETGEMYFSQRNRAARQVACDIMTIFCILVVSWRRLSPRAK